MRTVLVVDDEKQIRDSLEGVLTDEGFGVVVAGSGEEALDVIADDPPDLVLLDIWLPGIDGMETLKRIKASHPVVPVIMISGHANIETAVRATKLGAFDFIEKPLSLDKTVISVENAIERRRLVEENINLKGRAMSAYEIIGTSRPITELKRDIARVAPSNSWVLITGENGTGKEFVARNIHLMSNRSGRAFVEVNCAAIPEELIESELFGHEKGAFTSAVARKKGRFDMADKGTIFLDEIGDMSLKTQAKVLRILQEQSFERVGGTDTIKVDVRVIAATNKDLTEQIKAGTFREDLYYRLNVIPFHVPPLRERREDIPLFIDHFLALYAAETAREAITLDDEARAILTNYNWPGNIRELKNLIERLVIMTPANVVTASDMPLSIRGARAQATPDIFDTQLLKVARRNFEKEFILRRLKECGGNIARTAESIGIERSHLYRKIRSYGIEP